MADKRKEFLAGCTALVMCGIVSIGILFLALTFTVWAYHLFIRTLQG